MSLNPKQVVEGVTSVVQSAQGGYSVGSSRNGFEGYVNFLNLAGTIAGTSPIGVGLNGAAAVTGSIDLANRWTSGNLTPADVMGVTGSILGTILAIAAVSGAPITISAVAIAAGVSIIAGPGARDWFNDQATGLADAISDALGIGGSWPGVNDSMNRAYGDAITWRPRDPLAIDLDGDGIETVGVGSNPILFDHNADGIRTGTGWLRGDDAWLALDRNGNGVIDSGRELFGVDTLITDTNGQTRTARDGFEALRSVDSNGDGVFDANDEAFSQVRLWRDLNQDGTSDEGELFSLGALGITQIGLNKTNSTQTLADGTRLDGTGHFTINGQTQQYTDAWFAENPFYRQFAMSIEVSEEMQIFPAFLGALSLKSSVRVAGRVH